MELEKMAENTEQVVRVTLSRCGGDREKMKAELERQQANKIFYEGVIRFLNGKIEPAEDALQALVETQACIDALLDRLKGVR